MYSRSTSISALRIAAFLGWCLMAVAGQAQNLVGRIVDAQTGGPLPSANIVVKGTYSGTISNADGEFELRSFPLPYTLVVRYIGYHSQEIEVESIPAQPLLIRMEPNVRELGEVTVTGGNPAIEIMREVIRRKSIWRASLENYSAKAYTRQNLESDEDIASISETLSDIYWDKEKGSREVILSKRQTKNLGLDQNFASVGQIPNFYNDNLDIGGFNMVGPTHPDAFRYYHFELIGLRTLDHLTVFDIQVTPRRKLQPTFEGTLAVVDSAFVLLEIDLRPNDALVFPPPIQKLDLWFAQQFSNFGGDYWLPVDVRIRGEIKFGIIGLQFPEIGIDQMSRLTDYQVNTVLPDTLYGEGVTRRMMRIDQAKLATNNDSLFLSSPLVVPFTSKELAAYEEIDSTKTLEDAFKPRGFLARFVNTGGNSNGVTVSAGSSDGSGGSQGGDGAFRSRGRRFMPDLMPEGRFTRVDGLHLGLNATWTVAKQVEISTGGGYSVAPERFDYRAGMRFQVPFFKRTSLQLNYASGTKTQYSSSTTNTFLSSPNMILGRPDYFDHYRAEGFNVGLSKRFRSDWGQMRVVGRSEKHLSLEKATDYSLLKPDLVQRPNPGIEEGRMHSLGLHYVWGDDRIPFSIMGQNRLEVNVEVSNPDWFGGDYRFAKYEVAIDRRIPTFYQRRLFSNTLDLRFMAGTYTGDIPLQRFSVVDASPGYYAAFGSLRTLSTHPYVGEQYAVLHWEHNFRSIPFEALGWKWPARKGMGVIVYGSSGRTFIHKTRLESLRNRPDIMLAYNDGFHHEIGASLNGILGLGRLNFTKRLDAPGFRVGFAVTRYF